MNWIIFQKIGFTSWIAWLNKTWQSRVEFNLPINFVNQVIFSPLFKFYPSKCFWCEVILFQSSTFTSVLFIVASSTAKGRRKKKPCIHCMFPCWNLSADRYISQVIQFLLSIFFFFPPWARLVQLWSCRFYCNRLQCEMCQKNRSIVRH